MQKHSLKLGKVFTNAACTSLILISNNSELAAKFLPNDVDQSIKTLEIPNLNNDFFKGINIKQEKKLLLAENNNENDELNDPLITKDRIELMNILSSDDLELIFNLTLKVNEILKSFFKNIQLQLVDFKLEYGYDLKNNILLGDEISPDNCRLWDLNQKNDTIVSLDKDRFRNDLGGLIEAYSEIHRRINNFL